tara:strand:- start:398 stop:1192 length:795 start_codon:yes stop_codon:yes gene_type:complete
VNELNITNAAAYISSGRLEPRTIGEQKGELSPQSESEAYRVQSEVHSIISKKRGDEIIGWKIGCTTPVMQSYLNIDEPCAGGIFKSTVYFEDALIKHTDFLNPGVECELAAFIDKDLEFIEKEHTYEVISDAVGAIFPAIEIVDSRWNDYKTVNTFSLIADDFFGAGCVLGRPETKWRNMDLKNIKGEMKINGSSVGQGKGEDILGDPIYALVWLTKMLKKQGTYLKQGDIVMLGSLVQTNWVNQMDQVEVEIDGLGTASVWFG